MTNAGHIQSNGTDIHVDYNSTPFINDWNEDGKKDLLTGETGEYGGTDNVRVYINTGTDAAPVFGSYTAITCGGNPINLQRTCPVVYDLDRDGIKDLMTSEINGYVWFYHNSGTNAAPVFNTSERLSTQFAGYIVDGLAEGHITFNDWDQDGDLDLIFGEYGPSDGNIRVYLNLTFNPGVAEDQGQVITQNKLSISPNPTTNYALVKYTLIKSSSVKIEILSSDGRLVASPINQYQEQGVHQFIWNRQENVPNGVYFVRLITDDNKQVKRFTLLR